MLGCQFMVRWMENVWLSLVLHQHFLDGDTVLVSEYLAEHDEGRSLFVLTSIAGSRCLIYSPLLNVMCLSGVIGY